MDGEKAPNWEDAADEFGFGELEGGKPPSPPPLSQTQTHKKKKKKRKEKYKKTNKQKNKTKNWDPEEEGQGERSKMFVFFNSFFIFLKKKVYFCFSLTFYIWLILSFFHFLIYICFS